MPASGRCNIPSRTPWRQTAKPDSAASFGEVISGLDVAPLGRGPAGQAAGRVFHRLRLRAQEETTAQVGGCYPFVVERGFQADEEVTPELLHDRGIIKKAKHDVVVLGNGELSKPLRISAHRFTKSAREKIEKAGGAVSVIE